MNRHLSGLIVLCLSSSVAIAATCRNDSGSKQRIQAADEISYRAVKDGQFWRSPEIFIKKDGIDVKLPESRLEKRSLSIEETLLLLNQQSCSIWPYGAIVMLSEASILSPVEEYTDVRKVLFNLQNALKKDGFKVDLWPSG